MNTYRRVHVTSGILGGHTLAIGFQALNHDVVPGLTVRPVLAFVLIVCSIFLITFALFPEPLEKE